MARRTALLMLLMVLSVTLLGASPTFRVGIVMLDADTGVLADVLAASAGTFGSSIQLSYQQQQVLREQQLQVLQQEHLEALHAAYKAQDPKALAALMLAQQDAPVEISAILSCTYTVQAYDETLAELLRSGNAAIHWYMQRSQYDALFLLQSQSMGDLNRVLVEFVFTDRTVVLDRLVQYGAFQSLESALDEQILRLFGSDDQGVLRFEKTDIPFSVFVDGEKSAKQESLFFLQKGSHTVQIVAPGYEDVYETVVVESKTITTLSVVMKKKQQPVLHVHSLSGKVSWFVDGRPMGTGLSISLVNPAYPLVLTGTKSGFSSRIVQLDEPKEHLEVAFRAAVIPDEVLVLDSQKDFYKRLRSTILLFGVYVGVTTLSNTFNTSQPLWQVGLVASSSLALVSSVSLIMELASYAARAGSGL